MSRERQRKDVKTNVVPRRRAMLVRGSLKSLEPKLFVFIGKPVGDCVHRWHPANFKRVRL